MFGLNVLDNLGRILGIGGLSQPTLDVRSRACARVCRCRLLRVIERRVREHRSGKLATCERPWEDREGKRAMRPLGYSFPAPAATSDARGKTEPPAQHSPSARLFASAILPTHQPTGREPAMKEPIISVSGLRGIVGESLSPEVAMRYVSPWAAIAPPGPVVVTRDGRATGRMLADAVRSGLQAVGRTAIDADIAATPTTGVLVREYGAAGGVQISASHNPAEYNGLKLFSAEGRVISAAAGQRVIERYRSAQTAWVPYQQLGGVETCVDALGPHWSLVRPTIDVERIRAARFSVLLDSNHGAGSLLGRRLLEELGCQLTIVGGDARRSVRAYARTNGRKPGRHSAACNDRRGRCRFLPGSRC